MTGPQTRQDSHHRRSVESVSRAAFTERGDSHSFDPLLCLPEFERRFPHELALFEVVGIHPHKNRTQRILNPYTKAPASESFVNIGEHCIAVACGAEKIATSLVTRGVLPRESAEAIVGRALIHDLNKPYEIMRRAFHKPEDCGDAYTPTAYEMLEPLLTSLGTPASLASTLVNAGTETGHNSLKNLITFNSLKGVTLREGHLSEKIIHLVDSMTFSPLPTGESPARTTYVTAGERIAAREFFKRYPFMQTEGLAVDLSMNILHVRDIQRLPQDHRLLGSYTELQVRVSELISYELMILIDPQHRGPPEHFVRDLLRY